MSNQPDSLARTPLFDLHHRLEAKMAPFAGWDMPLQYEGVIAEHRWCRTSAGLFDVSHMAVIELWGDDPAASLERLTAINVVGLGEGRQRYGLLLNDGGGVIDDFIVTNWGAHLTMVANASRRAVDLEHLRAGLPELDVIEKPEIALLAVQGPKAADIVVGHDPSLVDTVFLDNRMAEIGGIQIAAGRSGYTGEDGFELAVAADRAAELAELLLQDPALRPIGLAARDTLRLEAGLCLYGNDLDETTSPVEADLTWTVHKRRREAADFPGAERILAELADGPSRRRVGLKPDGKRPVRDGSALRTPDGEPAGTVSSGGFGPTVDHPVAMAYVSPDLAEPGTALVADVRGKDQPTTVVDLPFTPHHYHRGA